MALRVLVTGLLSPSSGKTALASGLVAGLRQAGVKAGVLKPFSWHDWYLDYRDTRLSLDKGIPLSADAVELREAAGLRLPLEILNPVHCVLAPPHLPAFYKLGVPSAFFSYLSSLKRRAILLRITQGEGATVVYRNAAAAQRGLILLDDQLLSGMVRRADKVSNVSSGDELLSILHSAFSGVIAKSIDTVERKCRVLVIESFHCYAWPLPISTRVDIVVLTIPGAAVVYDGERYRTAVAIKGSMNAREVLTRDLLGLLTPTLEVRIGHLVADELPEMRAEKVDELTAYVLRLLEGG